MFAALVILLIVGYMLSFIYTSEIVDIGTIWDKVFVVFYCLFFVVASVILYLGLVTRG